MHLAMVRKYRKKMLLLKHKSQLLTITVKFQYKERGKIQQNHFAVLKYHTGKFSSF